MKCLFRKPPIEILAATFARRRRCLVTTLRVAAGTRKSDMEMVIVSPPRSNLGNPGSPRPALTAQRALDSGVVKNALHQVLSPVRLQQEAMLGCPDLPIDIHSIPRNNVDRRNRVSLGRAEPPTWHRR